jgi:hypothetical protein
MQVRENMHEAIEEFSQQTISEISVLAEQFLIFLFGMIQYLDLILFAANFYD